MSPNTPASSSMDIDPRTEEAKRKGVLVVSSQEVAQAYRIVRFKHRPMILVDVPYPHFVPLHRERFDKIAYPILGGVSRSRMSDVYSYLASTAEDLSSNEHLVGFGVPLSAAPIEADTDIASLVRNKPVVWDMRGLRISRDHEIDDTVWRSPYSPVPLPPIGPDQNNPRPRLAFIMDLANNDTGVYDDIMQSIAPLIMEKKPDGVVWWVGSGANGKSTLMDALYRIFPGQLASINVKRLVDGRDTPSLNGQLANIVKESSEGRVDDTEIYKALGTHENFRVHKFHSQDDVEINGNIHTIFSANTIPSFNDKGYSARRRTFIIPFTQQFTSDPDFERRTFTPEFFGQLLTETLHYAEVLRSQQYRYKWSAATRSAKLDYDREANCAEEYARNLIDEGVVAFNSYRPVKIDYENWCADEGYVPLGIGNLRRALGTVGFHRTTQRADDNRMLNVYTLPEISPGELVALSLSRPGLFTISGFQKPTEPKPIVPEAVTSILNKEW